MRTNLGLTLFSVTKIPLLGFVCPRFLELTDARAVIKIPFGFRTRNHLRSMYFGAMAIGADLVIGGFAWSLIEKGKYPVNLIFKDFKADYLKRAEADVHFVCDAGADIQALIDAAVTSGERVTRPIPAYALVPTKFGDEPVATFELTLSLKVRS
jgi:acyl-coenzyme A thioesterase PaaI-like protein